MANDGLMTASAFGQTGPERRGDGLGQWQHRAPAAPPPPASAETKPAATPAAAMAAVADRLAQVAEGGPARLANLQEQAEFEAQLNAAVAAAGTDRVAGAPVLGGAGWQRPTVVEAPGLGDLAAKMGAALAQLAPGGRRRGVVGAAGPDAPNPADLELMEAQLNALVHQPAAERRPVPEKGSLAARVRELEGTVVAAASPEELHQADQQIAETFEELNSEVHAAQAAADVFGTYGEPRPELDEQLAERARSNPRGLSAAEAGAFEAGLNAQIAALARNPELTRPGLPEPAPAKPAAEQPAAQPAADPLADVDPAVLLRAIEKLGVSEEQLAGLLAGDDEGGTA
jgi:hypothetical protein